jgi:hypothetical protein
MCHNDKRRDYYYENNVWEKRKDKWYEYRRKNYDKLKVAQNSRRRKKYWREKDEQSPYNMPNL